VVAERRAGAAPFGWRAALVLGALLLAGGALGGSLYWKFLVPHQLAVREADRAALVTIRDLEHVLKGFTHRSDAELLRKTLHPNGVIELRYEYLHPDQQRELYLLCRIEVHPSRKSAREAYARLANRETPEAPISSIAYADLDDTVPWADSARLGVLTQGGKPRGHCILCRQDDRVLCVELFGQVFEDGEGFQDIVFPRLDALAEYAP
jgi:hypothetical protein